MLYDPIFSKSFSRFEQQKIGRLAFLGCAVIALSICTVFKPQYHVRVVSSIGLQVPRSIAGVDTAKDHNVSEPLQYLSSVGTDAEADKEATKDASLQASTSAVKDGVGAKNVFKYEPLQLSDNDGVNDTKTEKDVIAFNPVQSSSNDGVKDGGIAKDTSSSVSLFEATGDNVTDSYITKDTTGTKSSVSLFEATGDNVKDTSITKDTTGTKPLQSSTGEGVKGVIVSNQALVPEPIGFEAKLIKLVCSLSEPISDYCEIEGDIRINPNSSTIFVVSHQSDTSFDTATSRIIKPYARKGNEGAMQSVKSWTIKVIPSHRTPSCTTNQNNPAILFSLAGYSGNHFHDFSDIIIPLFSTSRKFDGEVHLLATDYKSWWSAKYRGILGKLSKHKLNDIDREERILCYKSMIIGLKTRKELGIAQSPNIHKGSSMKDFRDFLRSAYSLKTKNVIKLTKGTTQKPRMMIISRKKSRTLVNENKIAKMSENMGYEVIVADATLSTDLSKFAELVNSCSVLIGVHGAGLTNMVFLPDNAVVIQIVPLGIEWYARHDFEEPAADMNIRYLSYKIKVKESSLIQEYSVKSATIRNSLSVNKNDWDVIRSVYLDRQNVIVDVRRFRRTLSKAWKLLHQ